MAVVVLYLHLSSCPVSSKTHDQCYAEIKCPTQWTNLGISSTSKHVLNACTWIVIGIVFALNDTAPFNQSFVWAIYTVWNTIFTWTTSQNALIGHFFSLFLSVCCTFALLIAFGFISGRRKSSSFLIYIFFNAGDRCEPRENYRNQHQAELCFEIAIELLIDPIYLRSFLFRFKH